MTSRLILTLAALLALAACANDMPIPEPGIAVTGETQMGVVIGGSEATTTEN